MKQLVVKPEKCIGCRTCELVCSFGHYQQFNPRLANITVLEYEAATLAVPVVCQQCEDASCMKVCPVKAIRRDENGACVINYDIPEENEYYVHRIGRTGRARRKGVAWSLVSNFPEKAKLDEICKFCGFTVAPMCLGQDGTLTPEVVKTPAPPKRRFR